MSEESYIPFGRPDFSDDEIAAVAAVLRSGWVGAGPEVAHFEHELAAATASPHVLALSSCTAALTLSLALAGVGPGDEVVCPSLTWFADANVIVHRGAVPVFCEIDPMTLNVTADSVLASLTKRTKAVIAVHFGGFAADVAAIRAALPDGVTLIEDAAHAFGGSYRDGSPVGGSGNLTCFSFYANKNLSTGEGGALALLDRSDAERCGWLRQQGVRHDAWGRQRISNGLGSPELVEPGYKMAMTDIAASIGRVQLRRQAEFAARRMGVAQRYVDVLSGLVSAGRIQLQEGLLASDHARHLMAIQLVEPGWSTQRSDVVERLRALGVGASVPYSPMHREASYGSRARLPITDDVASRLMMLPISASMSVDDAERCAVAVVDELSRA